MLGEPLLLGLVVAPSWAGLGVAIAAIGAFLTRHPAKLALADRLRKASYPRTAVAERFILFYGAVTLAGVGLALDRGAAGWWVPLALAAPLALIQLAYDARHQGRGLAPELLGGAALGSVAAAEMLAAGFAPAPAITTWVLVAAKAVSTVLYVRARLRYDRGLNPDRTSAVVANASALALSTVLAAGGRAPWLAVGAFALLLARAVYGLSPLHRRVRPQAVGVQEMAYGFSFVLIVALAYAIGL
jgi:YwiC-like protein